MAVTYVPRGPEWGDRLSAGTQTGLDIGRSMLMAKQAKQQEVLDRLNAQRIQQVMKYTDTEEQRQSELFPITKKSAQVDLNTKQRLAEGVNNQLQSQELAVKQQRASLEEQRLSQAKSMVDIAIKSNESVIETLKNNLTQYQKEEDTEGIRKTREAVNQVALKAKEEVSGLLNNVYKDLPPEQVASMVNAVDNIVFSKINSPSVQQQKEDDMKMATIFDMVRNGSLTVENFGDKIGAIDTYTPAQMRMLGVYQRLLAVNPQMTDTALQNAVSKISNAGSTKTGTTGEQVIPDENMTQAEYAKSLIGMSEASQVAKGITPAVYAYNIEKATNKPQAIEVDMGYGISYAGDITPLTYEQALREWNNDQIHPKEMWSKFSNYLMDDGYDFIDGKIVKSNSKNVISDTNNAQWERPKK